MIIIYLAEYRSKQANKLRIKLPCIKKRKMVNVGAFLEVYIPMLLLRINLMISVLNEQFYT